MKNNFCNIAHLIYITGTIRAQWEAITNTLFILQWYYKL